MAWWNKVEWPVDQMRHWYEVDGKTVAEIGALLGRSPKVVNKVCKRSGFRMRPRGQKFGPGHKGWKGGRTTDKNGYILVYMPDHPNANSNGYFREHRAVMEKKIGRLLQRNEVVHHIDDNPANNHPDNLELFQSNTQHLAETLKGKVPKWTQAGIDRIAAGIATSAKSRASRHSLKPGGQA